MIYRPLGQTGLEVSVIGLGGIGFARTSAAQAEEILVLARANGINLIDTAASYGPSEETIGNALAAAGLRSGFLLATKSLGRDWLSVRADLEASLARLRTDNIDLFQLHDVRYEEEFAALRAPGGALPELRRAQAEGKIRHLGISCHQPGLVGKIIESGEFATLQIPLNIIDAELFAGFIRPAVDAGLGLIAMKPLAGGALTQIRSCFRFALSYPISAVIPGISSPAQLEEDLLACRDPRPFSPEELFDLRSEAGRLGQEFCRRCGYCQPCPANIDIPTLLRLQAYYETYEMEDWAREQYAALKADSGACRSCGDCLRRCPYGLPTQGRLAYAHWLLGTECVLNNEGIKIAGTPAVEAPPDRRWAIRERARPGAMAFTDERSYFARIPAPLLDLPYLQGPAAPGEGKGSRPWLEIAVPAMVYCAIPAEEAPLDHWAGGWEETGEVLGLSSGEALKIYRRNYDAGRVDPGPLTTDPPRRIVFLDLEQKRPRTGDA